MKPVYLITTFAMILVFFAIAPVSAFSVHVSSPHVSPHVSSPHVSEVHVSEAHISEEHISEPSEERVSEPSKNVIPANGHLSTPNSVTDTSQRMFIWYYPWTWIYWGGHTSRSDFELNSTNASNVTNSS